MVDRPPSSRRGAAETAQHDEATVADLARAWAQRCNSTGVATGPADDAERYAMLVALDRAAAPGALARVRGLRSAAGPGDRPRPAGTVAARRQALDEAAEAWGARLASPMGVAEQMLLLRHLIAGSSEGERIGRLVDRSMVAAIRAATGGLQAAAFSDPLTGCANRRALERDLERELARCARAELDLAVVAIDVDGLKAINDTGGHQAGDDALLRLVETLRRVMRSLDGVYRVGGDEFIVVLPDTGAEEAELVMSRIVREDPPPFSWGVASVADTGCFEPHLLLAAADDRLYDRRRAARGLQAARTAAGTAGSEPGGAPARFGPRPRHAGTG